MLDSSSVTAPFFLHKHTRSKGPFLRRSYPASSVVWPSPTPRLAAALAGDVRGRDPQPIPSLPHSPKPPSLHAVLHTPVDRIRCSLVGELRVPRAGFFPVRTAFPVIGAGRRPHHYFRGLLKLHTRYGLHSCSPTIRGLYREASPSPVSRLGRSQATKFNQQPPWVGPSPTGDLRC